MWENSPDEQLQEGQWKGGKETCQIQESNLSHQSGEPLKSLSISGQKPQERSAAQVPLMEREYSASGRESYWIHVQSAKCMGMILGTFRKVLSQQYVQMALKYSTDLCSWILTVLSSDIYFLVRKPLKEAFEDD